jgi:hypothetical protein
MHALAAFSGLELLEARTDFPPRLEGGRRHDYGKIDSTTSYWGDTVGVFRKRAGRQRLPLWVTRRTMQSWVNKVDMLESRELPVSRASPRIIPAPALPPWSAGR